MFSCNLFFFLLLHIFLSFSLYNNTINIYINIWRTTVCECFLAHLTGCQVKLNYFLSCNDSVKYNLNYSNCYYTHVRLRLHASKNGLQDTYTYVYNNHMFTYTLRFTTSVNVGSIMVFLFSKRNTFAWSARLLKFMVIMNWFDKFSECVVLTIFHCKKLDRFERRNALLKCVARSSKSILPE